MKRVLCSALLISALGFIVAGCGLEVSGDDSQGPTLDDPSESTADAVSACGVPAPVCASSKGVTTCVTTTQTIVADTHVAFSGCTAFNGASFVPGARARTFADQVLVTVTTTTLQHGRHGKIFDTSTVTTREILSSTLISDVCTPL